MKPILKKFHVALTTDQVEKIRREITGLPEHKFNLAIQALTWPAKGKPRFTFAVLSNEFAECVKYLIKAVKNGSK